MQSIWKQDRKWNIKSCAFLVVADKCSWEFQHLWIITDKKNIQVLCSTCEIWHKKQFLLKTSSMKTCYTISKIEMFYVRAIFVHYLISSYCSNQKTKEFEELETISFNRANVFSQTQQILFDWLCSGLLTKTNHQKQQKLSNNKT